MTDNIEFTKQSHLFSELALNKMSFNVKLGVTAEERQVPQKVNIYVKLIFQTPPKAIESDDIANSFCYQAIFDGIENLCQNGEFKLIEALCYQIFCQLKELVKDKQTKLWIKIEKSYAPLKGKLESASFVLSD